MEIGLVSGIVLGPSSPTICARPISLTLIRVPLNTGRGGSGPCVGEIPIEMRLVPSTLTQNCYEHLALRFRFLSLHSFRLPAFCFGRAGSGEWLRGDV